MRPKHGNLLFVGVIAFIVAVYVALRWLGPIAGAWLPAPQWFSIPDPLPSSGFERTLYLLLVVAGIYCWLSYKEERWQAFSRPPVNFMAKTSAARTCVLILFPIAVAVSGFYMLAGGAAGPAFNPIRHPTPPNKFSTLKNPYRTPTLQMLDDFDTAIRSGQLQLESTTEQEVMKYIALIEDDHTDMELRSRAYFRHIAEEGRILFAINCRPCHGIKAKGDGPLAQGLLREPADFTGVETIATLVEGAVFWRVKTGGISLPHEGAPWESAMPSWKRDLTDDQIWKIIIAEYDIAGNSPREPEKTE